MPRKLSGSGEPPWQGARGGCLLSKATCSPCPPAPQPAWRPGGGGKGHVPGSQLGAGGSWVVPLQHPLPRCGSRAPACLCPLHSAETWGAPSSPGGVLCSLRVGLHTRAPACVLRRCVESNTGTGTNKQPQKRACPWECAGVQVCKESDRAGANTKVCPFNTCTRTHVCQHAHPMHPECKYISGVCAHTAISHTSMQLRAPRDAVPCAAKHPQRWPPTRRCALNTKHKQICRGPGEAHLQIRTETHQRCTCI